MSAPLAFNPLDPEIRRDPYALYARGRREAPVLRHEGLPIPLHSVFRYVDIQSVLRDPEAWSSDFGASIPEERGEDSASMLGSDPPEHSRLRGLVNKAFTPRIVRQLEPRMRSVAQGLVKEALTAGEIDLVQALSYPLPVVVIADMIGIPGEDRERFKRWSDEAIASLGLVFFGGMDEERARRERALFDEMREYFVPLAEERKRKPEEDLLTGLVQAEHEGSHLDHSEMLSMLVLLLVAGNETTTTLIGNAVLALCEHPDQQARLRRDPGLLASAIDEVLRFSSPVQFDPRRAAHDQELAGVEIRQNELVLCWLGSANRDEDVFEEPDRFDVGREKNPHLAFGFGPHHCLGHNLARLEARVALDTLLEATRHFERSDSEPLPLHPSPVFRAATKIPLRLQAK